MRSLGWSMKKTFPSLSEVAPSVNWKGMPSAESASLRGFAPGARGEDPFGAAGWLGTAARMVVVTLAIARAASRYVITFSFRGITREQAGPRITLREYSLTLSQPPVPRAREATSG